MSKVNKVLLYFCLVSISYGLAQGAESPVGFLVKSTSTFADIDKNGVIDSSENKAFESEKLKIFDLDHDGKLNAIEKAKFEDIDKIISAGGKSLEELSDSDRQLYKKWRTFILSLIQKSEEKADLAKKKKSKEKSITKCYPDKICDDPTNPHYGTVGSDPMINPKPENINSAQPANR